MAKRKLSLKQREAVRKEIRQGLAKKKKPADILKAVAHKYGITTITGRWYLKSVRLGKPAANGKPRISRHSSGSARRSSQAQPVNGATMTVVHHIQAVAEKTFKRILEAKKLIPKWQDYVKKEASLREIESKVKSQLRNISTKAAALHRKIQALTAK